MHATNPKLMFYTVYCSVQQLGQALASLLLYGGLSMAQLAGADIEGAS